MSIQRFNRIDKVAPANLNTVHGDTSVLGAETRSRPSQGRTAISPRDRCVSFQSSVQQRRMERLLAVVGATPLFRAFGASIPAEVQAELEPVQLRPRAALFHQGEPGDSLYFLVDGQLEISMRMADGANATLDVLQPGAVVGEMALLTGQPRVATAHTSDGAELIKLSKAGFNRLSAAYSEALTAWAQTIVPRWRELQTMSALTNLFGELDPGFVAELQVVLEWQHLATGEVLFRQGEPSDGLYVVVNGRLKLVATDAEGRQGMGGEAGWGESVGEFAMLTGKPRRATAHAIRDTDVVKLSQTAFERLHERHPRRMLQMVRGIVRCAQSEARADRGQSAAARTVAIVPLHPGVPATTEFSRRLSEALAEHGSTLYLSSAQFDHHFGRRGAAQTRWDDPTSIAVSGWLTEQELNHQHVVYETDAHWSAWTQRCLRQADRILLVAQADDDAALAEIGAGLRRINAVARTELVLLQPEGCSRPTGTQRWLAARHVAAHHHVRMHVPGDVQRLARRIIDRAVALVLSGGGARGFVHVGVIRALEEAGVSIDVVGGTSMGALIGAATAMDLDSKQIYGLAQTFASRRQLLDRTLPISSLMASAKVASLYRGLFGDIQIEDLWRPYFCVSSNLTRAEPTVHTQGALWEAVRASTAIPGVFSPVLFQGDVLVDGGIINNFPIDLMRAQHPGGTIVASNASPRTEKFKDYRFGPSISGWQVLWSKLNPLVPSMRVPSIFDSVMRSTEINSIQHLSSLRGLANVLIEPSIGRFGALDFGAYAAIIEAGYEAARQHLPALKQMLDLSTTSAVPERKERPLKPIAPAQLAELAYG